VPFVRNNTDVILNTLELARQVKPKSFVLVSTDEVYGPVEADDYRGHAEWASVLPSNPYSASKAAQEAIAVAYWRTYGVPLQIVNCMNMIGERQDAEKYVPLVLRKVLRGKKVDIHGTEDHIGSRHYLHCRNLADGITFLLDRGAVSMFPAHASDYVDRFGFCVGDDRPDRYNIASPDRVDNLAMAQMIADYAGKPLRYELRDFHSTRPGHDPHYGLDGSKMAALGWTPPVSLETSLKHTIEWTIQNPHWLLKD
jgi:dTDP-glucose 4,6-dehydratase